MTQQTHTPAVKFNTHYFRSEGFKALEDGLGWREATLVASLLCMSHAEQQRFLVPDSKQLFRSWFETIEFIIDGIRVVMFINQGGVALAGSDESVIEAALPMISEDPQIAQFEFLLRGCMSSEQFHRFIQQLRGVTAQEVAALAPVLFLGAPISSPMSSEEFHRLSLQLLGVTTREVAALALVLVGGAPIVAACQGMPPEQVKKLFGSVCDLALPHVEAVAA